MGGEFTTVNGSGGTPMERVASIKETKEASNQPQQVNTSRQMKLLELTGEHFSVGEEHLIKAIERANKALQGAETTFEFSVHEKTKQIMVKVLDKEKGTIIREIPPEKTLDLVAKLWELAGIVVDERR